MLLKALVKALVQQSQQGGDELLHLNLISTLKRDIRRDVVDAFDCGKPLVDQYPSLYNSSSSYVDFLFKLCDAPPQRPRDSDDLRTLLNQCHEEKASLEEDSKRKDEQKQSNLKELKKCHEEKARLEQDSCRKDHRLRGLEDELETQKDSFRRELFSCHRNEKILKDEMETLKRRLDQQSRDSETERNRLANRLRTCEQEKRRLENLANEGAPPMDWDSFGLVTQQQHDHRPEDDDRGGERIAAGLCEALQVLQDRVKESTTRFETLAAGALESTKDREDLLQKVESIRTDVQQIVQAAKTSLEEQLHQRLDEKDRLLLDQKKRIEEWHESLKTLSNRIDSNPLLSLIQTSKDEFSRNQTELAKTFESIRATLQSSSEEWSRANIIERLEALEAGVEKNMNTAREAFLRLVKAGASLREEMEDDDLSDIVSPVHRKVEREPPPPPPNRLLDALKIAVPKFEYFSLSPWTEDLAFHLEEGYNHLMEQLEMIGQHFRYEATLNPATFAEELIAHLANRRHGIKDDCPRCAAHDRNLAESNACQHKLEACERQLVLAEGEYRRKLQDKDNQSKTLERETSHQSKAFQDYVVETKKERARFESQLRALEEEKNTLKVQLNRREHSRDGCQQCVDDEGILAECHAQLDREKRSHHDCRNTLDACQRQNLEVERGYRQTLQDRDDRLKLLEQEKADLNQKLQECMEDKRRDRTQQNYLEVENNNLKYELKQQELSAPRGRRRRSRSGSRSPTRSRSERCGKDELERMKASYLACKEELDKITRDQTTAHFSTPSPNTRDYIEAKETALVALRYLFKELYGYYFRVRAEQYFHVGPELKALEGRFFTKLNKLESDGDPLKDILIEYVKLDLESLFDPKKSNEETSEGVAFEKRIDPATFNDLKKLLQDSVDQSVTTLKTVAKWCVSHKMTVHKVTDDKMSVEGALQKRPFEEDE